MTVKSKAIIIDDETNSRDSLLNKLAQYCPQVQVVALCQDGEEGIDAIETQQPNIVFLDVEMPRMNGFTMLQQLSTRNFEVIFTTAYDHYAIQALRFSAIDYLVKPIDTEELIIAVGRSMEKRQSPVINQRIENLLHNIMHEKTYGLRIAIPVQEGLEFIEQQDILYLEAKSNYTEITMVNGTRLVVSKTLKDFEELLPGAVFIRIHHSWLINKFHVKKYVKGDGGQVIMRNDKALDVARRKKEEFLKSIRE